MLIDPHVNPYNADPDELLDALIDASLDGALISCTHSARDALPYLKALEEEDFVGFVGVELLTSHGALVFVPREANETFFKASWNPNKEQAEQIPSGVEGESISVWSLEALQERLKGEQGVTFVVHPFSRLASRAWGDRAYTLNNVSAVETRVGRGLAVRDFLCDQVAEQKGWARLGSCGGDLTVLGSAATALLDSVETQSALCEALERGVCWPVEFERPDHPRPRYQGVVEDEGPRRVTLAEKERKEALAHVNRARPQRGGAPIDQIFAQGRPPKRKEGHGGRGGRPTQRSPQRASSRQR